MRELTNEEDLEFKWFCNGFFIANDVHNQDYISILGGILDLKKKRVKNKLIKYLKKRYLYIREPGEKVKRRVGDVKN